jgi:hypothetical protein
MAAGGLAEKKFSPKVPLRGRGIFERAHMSMLNKYEITAIA